MDVPPLGSGYSWVRLAPSRLLARLLRQGTAPLLSLTHPPAITLTQQIRLFYYNSKFTAPHEGITCKICLPLGAIYQSLRVKPPKTRKNHSASAQSLRYQTTLFTPLTLGMRLLLILLFTYTITPSLPAQDLLQTINTTRIHETHPTPHKHIFRTATEEWHRLLAAAPHWKKSKIESWPTLTLPDAHGESLTVRVAEAPIAQEPLYSMYPENKTYKVAGLPGQYLSGRLSLTTKGLSGLIIMEGEHLFIEALGDGLHIAYHTSAEMKTEFSCGTAEEHDIAGRKAEISQRSASGNSNGATLKEYVMAIAITGEFADARNDNITVINGDINTYLSTIAAFYESELAVTFILSAANNNLLFLDPNTDPFTPPPTNYFANQTALNSGKAGIGNTINDSDYDIGHTLHDVNSAISGIAYVGVICYNPQSFKAGGWTQFPAGHPLSEVLSLFGHEVGHQFGSNHTMYGTVNGCASRNPNHGYEPGSGNSIMSYEGICANNSNTGCTGNHNITPTVGSSYFHSHSIEQMLGVISGTNCESNSSSGNTPPVVSVPANVSIPKGTPFELTATANDADGDPLTYAWEQYDTDDLSLSCPDGAPNDAATSTTAPLFRTFDPSTSPTRSFPRVSDLANNTQTQGEILPDVARNITMRVTVRDNNPAGGGIECQDVEINVVNTGIPFSVSTANTATTYSAGQNINVQWDVASTNQAPINCQNVNILWSNDGGYTFPITLASNVSNDGAHMVTLPSIGTTIGRIKVEAADNIFFDINNTGITILSACSPVIGTIVNDDALSADAGDPALNFDLISGTFIPNMSGSVTPQDPTMTFAAKDNMDNCINPYGNTQVFHDVHTFAIDYNGSATVTLDAPSWFQVGNLYYGPVFDPTNTCQNWLNCSAYQSQNGFTITSTLSGTFSNDQVYTIVMSNFPGQSGGSYTISIGAGDLYDVDFIPSGYDYTYLTIDDANVIRQVATSPDLSNSGSFPGGVYKIYGLNFAETDDPSTYVGQTKAALEADIVNGNFCGAFSGNYKEVTITGGCSPGTYTVSSGADNGGATTLRTLISNACAGDIFQISTGVGIAEANTSIIIDRPITVIGNGPAATTISGLGNSRIFDISTGGQLTLQDLKLINGSANPNGGAIHVQTGGELLLEDCILENNNEGGTPKALTNDGTVRILSGNTEIKDE